MLRLKVVSPSEFWQLTPSEAGLFIDEQVREHEERKKPAQNSFLTAEQRKHLDKRRAQALAKGIKVL